MRQAHTRIATLFLVPALLLLAALPAAPQQDDAARLTQACMASEDDEAYCRCASDILANGLTGEEMSMFLAYLETDNDQDAQFLYAMLPNDKITALFDQAEVQCRSGAPSPAVQGDERQRMVNQCVDYGEDPGYCECAVGYIQAHLTPDEFVTMLLSMEAETPEQEEQYLSQLDQARVEQVFDDADRACQPVAETMPDNAQQNRLTDAKVRLVSVCQAEGENPGDCQCFADELATRLSVEEIHLVMDVLAAEDAGDADRADWLRGQLDQDRLDQAFNHVEQTCGIDF